MLIYANEVSKHNTGVKPEHANANQLCIFIIHTELVNNSPINHWNVQKWLKNKLIMLIYANENIRYALGHKADDWLHVLSHMVP